jgi:hypothetical protein
MEHLRIAAKAINTGNPNAEKSCTSHTTQKKYGTYTTHLNHLHQVECLKKQSVIRFMLELSAYFL